MEFFLTMSGTPIIGTIRSLNGKRQRTSSRQFPAKLGSCGGYVVKRYKEHSGAAVRPSLEEILEKIQLASG
ncbi:hypothetical protein CRG98_040007 [Punica granatum]|uniref:Uncharacterized protein n=1 Tax=Punica granatum TaxID=22663 RepID=A0A2I0I6D0_PUNGR|nr:hypothetical protein CRG98_040007 [Punica granatum]